MLKQLKRLYIENLNRKEKREGRYEIKYFNTLLTPIIFFLILLINNTLDKSIVYPTKV